MKPPLPPATQAAGVALLTAGLALTSAFAMSRILHAHAARTSHQLPWPEIWCEAPTPTSPALVARGRTLFLDSCAHCHGADATGDEGPDLHGLQVSDRYIANTITRGIPHEMPSFAKKHGPSDLAALTAYLRSLSGE